MGNTGPLSVNSLLVVDDDPDILALMEDLFKEEVGQIYTASHANTAISLLSSTSIDLAIIDIRMPDISGIELCREIESRGFEVKTVLLSGCGNREELTQALNCNVRGFIAKPACTNQLKSTIFSLFSEINSQKFQSHTQTLLNKYFGSNINLSSKDESIDQRSLSNQHSNYIGELKKYEEYFEKSVDLDMTLHNLRNPITIIDGFTKRLKKRYPQDPEIDKVLCALERINEILSHAAEDEGESSTETKKKIDINQILRSILTVTEVNDNPNNMQGVRLETNFNEVAFIWGEETILFQCFSNIVENAIDAMRNCKEKILKITTCMRDKYTIAISISDNGIGIAKEELDKIYKPFYTTKSDSGRKSMLTSGSGIGLSFVSKAIETFGGEIKVSSEPLKGTTFDIYLPIIKSRP